MKRALIALVILLLPICLFTVVHAQSLHSLNTVNVGASATVTTAKEFQESGQGDVQIHLNGGKDKAIIGATNTLEIWIGNGAKLVGMSVGFEVKSVAAFRWLQPYGTAPASNPLIKEEGDVNGAFDFGGLKIKRAAAPSATVDSLLLGGAASETGLPKHKKLTLCYSLQFRIPSSETAAPGGFCVKDIFVPPAGSWTFNDGAGYTPNFQGRPVLEAQRPNAPAACFDIVKQQETGK